MNLPLGILALLGILFFFKEEKTTEKRSVDLPGSLWVMVSVSSLIVILVEGGTSIAWLSWGMAGLAVIAGGGALAFLFHERKMKDPMMPLDLWQIRSIRYSNATSLVTGMILIGVSSYLPAFVQGVMEQSATVAGFTLTTMSIGWPAASAAAGRLFLRIGFRPTALAGGVALIVGSIVFSLLSPEKGPLFAAAGSLFIGIGMGLTTTSFIVSIQNSVSWEKRGIATASNMFMRTIGSALGAALLGGLLNSRVSNVIEEAGMGSRLSIDDTNALLREETRLPLGEDALDVLQQGLTSGLHIVYISLVLLAAVSFLLILQIPKKD